MNFLTDKEKKHQYCSRYQKDSLIDLVKADANLLSGKFTNDFTFKDAQKKWEIIASKLNAIPGGSKDWKQWKKTWQDIRTKTKSKQAAINRHARGSGGGPPTLDVLTSSEEKVLDVIAPITIDGNLCVNEPQIEFVYEDEEEIPSNENSSQQNVEAALTKNTEFPEVHGQKRKGEDVERENKKVPKKDKPISTKLVNSAKATSVLAETSQDKLNLQKDYWKKKLDILERQATAIENLVEFVQTNEVIIKIKNK